MKTTGGGAPLRRPLDGIRVLAVEHFMAGPYGSMLLADFGAEVIKIEPPGTGEAGRHVAPCIANERGMVSQTLVRLNRNKKSVALNLQEAQGQEIFRRLVGVSDVVWENLRPGTMDRLGLGYQTLRAIKPALIYASVSGFGHSDIYQSPYAQLPAFDIVAQGMSGLMLRAGKEGEPPAYLGFPLGDQYPSVLAAFGVVLALRWRDLTGEGRRVDISMYDALASLNELCIGLRNFTRQPSPRGTVGVSAPYDAFRVSDGYVVIAVVGEPIWERFCRTIGREDLLEDPNLERGMDRLERTEGLLRPIIEDWGRDKTRAQVVELLNAQAVPAAPVYDVDELLSCPHLRARNMLLAIDDPVAGRVVVAGNPIKMSGAPEPATEPSPQLGQHTAEVLSELLGLRQSDLAALAAEGVI